MENSVSFENRYKITLEKIKQLRERDNISVNPNNYMKFKPKNKKNTTKHLIDNVKYSKSFNEREKRIDKLFAEYHELIKNNKRPGIVALCNKYSLDPEPVIEMFERS